MALKINSSQLVYNKGNVYYFTQQPYKLNDLFYIYTNFSTLLNVDKIILYNTLTRDIGNILPSDVVNNIYLYRNWKDDRFAIFKRDLAQETIDQEAAGLLNPGSNMLTTLRRIDGGLINPQRLLVTEVPGSTLIGINFLDPTFKI